MMHTTYSSSSIISLRPYSAFNDYFYCSIEKCPSTYCSCCYSFPVNPCKLIVPTNPSFLYGLRQSTLIQCPPSRRFILGSSDRYCCRSSIYDVGRCCCVESSCVKMERVGGLVRRSCNEKCCVKEKRGVDVSKIKGRMERSKRDFRSNALGDAEAMLSLLSEGMVEEFVVDKVKRRSSPREGKVVSKTNVVNKPNAVIERVKDRKPNVVIERFKGRKPNVDFGGREGESKNYRLESSRVQGREEGRKRDEERESVSKDEDQRLRRRESSSSYYSLSDSGDFGSDVEVEIEKDQFVGESSTSHKKDSRKSGGVVISEVTKQGWERYRDEKDQELQSTIRDDFKVGGSIQRDWRKKSEKKLTEESEETNSRNVRQSQLSQFQQRSSMIASSSKKQSNYQEEQSTLNVTSLGQSSSHTQNDNWASRYSKSSSQFDKSTQKNRENVESTSTTWRRSSQGEDSKSVQETGCEYCKTCGTYTEIQKTQSDFQRHAESTEMSAKLTTSAESLSESRRRKHEKSLSSLQSSVADESKKLDQIHLVTGQASAERKSQLYHETISTDATRAQNTLKATQESEAQMRNLVEKSKTTAERQSESRRRKEEKSSSSLRISAKEENKLHDEICLETGQVGARRKFQHYSGDMNTDASYSQSTYRSHQQSETRMKHLEEKTASLIAAEEVKRLREESGGKVTKDIKTSKMPHAEIGDSGVHSSDLEINSHSASDKRVYNEQTYSKSKVKSVEELVEKRKRIDETIVQSTLSEVQGPATGHFPGEATISQPSIPLMSQTGIQQFGGEEVRGEHLSRISPPYQDVSGSQFHEASSSSVRNDVGRTIEAGSGSSHKHPQARTPSSYVEVYDRESTSSEEYTHEDALVSAARMQESSTLIVDEFVEKMSLEASTSEISTENKLAKLDLKHPDKIYMLKGSTESDSDKTGLQKQGSEHQSQVSSPDFKKKKPQELDSKRSSSDSETKGSSEQMWDVKDHFVQEASEMESLEGATSESVPVVARTGKSVWSTVAGICRLRWGSHSENQKSPVKGQTSPSTSAGGEPWFYGNEADEANVDGMKAEKLSSLQETTSSDQSLLEITGNQKEDVVVMNLDDKLSHVDAGASSSCNVLQSSSLSGDAFVGGNTNLSVPQLKSIPSPSVDLSKPSANLNVPQLTSLPSPSADQWKHSTNLTVPQLTSLPSPLVDLSKPSASQLKRLHAFEEIVEPEKNEAPISPSEEQRNLTADLRHTDVIASEGTDVELKRKKLQRSKVVLQRFDEWEDAYRREREQRKVDEIFMREALSEAMKAADSWEVPVGAVLVQNGKIIARGYNLVEELRDSTAHAEMLCIREASNVLRTWRLSETTLYVTLEPCPMCAGAILQARISSLVWGAPNKLLGADGSWIRLFPNGVEGEQPSEVTEKPAAPVHPFHPKMNIRRGILQEECADIMQQFFQLKRRKAKEKDTSSSDESGQPSCFPKPHHRSKLLHKMHNVFHPSKQQAD